MLISLFLLVAVSALYEPFNWNSTLTFSEGPNGTHALEGAKSASAPRTLVQWPTLAETGLSFSVISYGACALRLPHTHNCNEVLHVISTGPNVQLQVGLIGPNNGLRTANLTSDESTVFPAGYLHYQYNPTCSVVKAILMADDPFFQTTNFPNAYFALPLDIQTAAVNTTESNYPYNAALVNQSGLVQGPPECLRRCGLSSGSRKLLLL